MHARLHAELRRPQHPSQARHSRLRHLAERLCPKRHPAATRKAAACMRAAPVTGVCLSGCLARLQQRHAASALQLYPSSSWRDDLALAGAWLGRVTGQAAYVADTAAQWAPPAAGMPGPPRVWDWDTQWWAASLLMWQLTGEARFRAQARPRRPHPACRAGADRRGALPCADAPAQAWSLQKERLFSPSVTCKEDARPCMLGGPAEAEHVRTPNALRMPR